jgi:GAF domain-containing protein
MHAPRVPVSLRSWMSAASEIARAANADEPIDVLLGRVSAQACALIGFDYCAVMLAEPGGERLQVAGSAGLTADYLALVTDEGSPLVHPPGPAADTPAARAYRENRTVVVTDALVDGRYGRLRNLAETQGYRALLAVPLRTHTQRSGVVVGYSAGPRDFDPADQGLAELLADQAALALENARLRVAQQAAIAELSRANEELRRGRAVQEWAEQQHHALMQLTLADVGLAGLVTALAECLEASVTVEDPDGRVLAQAPDRDYRPPPTAAARRRGPTRTALEDQTRSYAVVRVPESRSGRPGAAAVGHPPTIEPGAWVAPVVLGGELAGRLWVVDPRASPAPVERRVIERFALVVGLELLKRRHVADAVARASGDLIGTLLRADGLEQRAAVERAAALGHDLARPHVVAVVAVDPPPTAGRWHGVVRAATERHTRGLVGPYEDLEILLVPADLDPAAALCRMHGHLQQSVPNGVAVTLVAGPIASGPDDVAAAYRIAAGAARLRRSARPGGFVDVRDLGLPSLLLESGPPDALRRYAQRLIEPIAEHDRRRGGDLLATLRTWLSTGCSTPDAAAELVVHPNTVAYRLANVERLTGRSLRRPDARMELQLAVTVHDLSGVG